jgi:hypothetical protein
MKAKPMQEVIVELSSGQDVQGVNWSELNSSLDRSYFRQSQDSKSKNIFGILDSKPTYPLEQIRTADLFAKAERFMPIPEINNYHF